MISKKINNEQFKEAIRISFTADDKIFKMYCPFVKVTNMDDIICDIYGRVIKDVNAAVIKGVYNGEELIGYYVYHGKTLVSFALNMKYRTRKYLKEFFGIIRKDLRGDWQCFLWTANQRGISWLVKNKMKVIAQDHLITHLTY